ncbi:syntaxin [Thraustotheca clavata]|uniref:Syntaxin n=1 Tax=Thraustotheca clavata TaxID=74557 RepID=A0A1V9Z2S8_9STRA|nr:syntaxin [Thraustotheca clavata]
MFNDPTNQINELTQLVKQDINIIHAKLDDLQVYQESQRAGYSSQQAAKHSDAIVSQMKTSLVSTTQGFKDILQVRQETLQHQHDRKSQYGRSNPSLLGKPLAFQSLPRPDGIDAGLEKAPLISTQNQELAVNEQSYAESRAQAVGSIQSHIVELGEIFQRLAVMISEQGEMVQRIDDNVDETVTNMSAGQEQLEKFYKSLSNNQLLTMKISAILLIFVVFFMFFLA